MLTTTQTTLKEPVLSSLLASRPVALAISGAAVIQTTLTYFGLPGWACPTLNFLNCPCPGCGLSRAIVALAQGDVVTMARYHALAPVFAFALGLIALGAILPTTQRTTLVNLTTLIEQKTAITGVFLIVSLAYWLVRLLFFYEPYLALMQS